VLKRVVVETALLIVSAISRAFIRQNTPAFYIQIVAIGRAFVFVKGRK
jgi:hypothetical protein